MRLVLCLLLALLSGCAQYQWQKVGSSQNEFNRDIYECQNQAARTYPVAVVSQQLTTGYTAPSQTSCYGGGGMVNCTTTPGQHFPGTVSTVDVNANNRSQAGNQCMYARGYRLVEVK